MLAESEYSTKETTFKYTSSRKSSESQEIFELAQEISTTDFMQPSSTQGATVLYQAVVYLSPSDYHRFHSPTDWTIHKRRHFPGKLYSVSPTIVRKMPGLFHVNERVVLTGTWEHGFFSMTAVGATNVGSIVINFDSELNTNISGQEFSEKIYEGGVEVGKGDEMGYFNFGSTIVLVFEAPKDFRFSKENMMRLKMGEGI